MKVIAKDYETGKPLTYDAVSIKYNEDEGVFVVNIGLGLHHLVKAENIIEICDDAFYERDGR